MAGSATELPLQISPPPSLLMRMGLFHNIKVMLLEMKDQFLPIRFLMIHHQKEAPLGIVDVKGSSEFFSPVPAMLGAQGSWSRCGLHVGSPKILHKQKIPIEFGYSRYHDSEALADTKSCERLDL